MWLKSHNACVPPICTRRALLFKSHYIQGALIMTTSQTSLSELGALPKPTVWGTRCARRDGPRSSSETGNESWRRRRAHGRRQPASPARGFSPTRVSGTPSLPATRCMKSTLILELLATFDPLSGDTMWPFYCHQLSFSWKFYEFLLQVFFKPSLGSSQLLDADEMKLLEWVLGKFYSRVSPRRPARVLQCHLPGTAERTIG